MFMFEEEVDRITQKHHAKAQKAVDEAQARFEEKVQLVADEAIRVVDNAFRKVYLTCFGIAALAGLGLLYIHACGVAP